MARFLFVLAGAAVLAILFVAMRPSPPPAEVATTRPASTSPAAPAPAVPPARVFEYTVQHKKVTGPDVIRVNQGDELTIAVTCDAAEELHLHGYNKKIDLKPNQRGELKFVADRSGRFEYELEHSKTELGALEVQPR